jgi:hypothetical protein
MTSYPEAMPELNVRSDIQRNFDLNWRNYNLTSGHFSGRLDGVLLGLTQASIAHAGVASRLKPLNTIRGLSPRVSAWFSSV